MRLWFDISKKAEIHARDKLTSYKKAPISVQILSAIKSNEQLLTDTQCKNSWNSCQDLAYSYIFPFTLETLDKILFILASHKPLEILDRTLGKSLIKSVKRNITVILFTSTSLLFALREFQNAIAWLVARKAAA